MKKTIFFFFLIASVILVSEANAQRKTYVGLKGGYNLSTAYFFHSFFGSDINTKMKGGFHGGIIAMNYIRNHIGLQAELNYSQKGWTQEFDDGSPDLITDLNYIELPLLVNIHTGKDRLHFFANGGCFFEYLVSSSQSEIPDYQANLYAFDESRDHKLGYGFRGGLGAFYDFDFGTLLLESSLSYSLSDVLEFETLDTGIPNTSKNIVVGFSVAYMFSFGEL